jgi:Rps23 Pro-64 3,4-dihydroxylase Tpa1-like proline 4-hydroxylase
MIDKENERTLNRDNKIFKHLNQTVSLTHLNETLKKEIEQSNQIKFEEVLNNSGVLFGEIATEINEKIQKNIYLDFENENNELTPSLISKGEIIND